MTGERCILLLPSVHDVMAAERILVRAGIWCDLVPTPKEISPECGMAVEIELDDRPAAVRLLLAGLRVGMRIYQKTGRRYTFLEAVQLPDHRRSGGKR